jgi:hypothetical protein
MSADALELKLLLRFRRHAMKFAALGKPAICVPWTTDPHWSQWTQSPNTTGHANVSITWAYLYVGVDDEGWGICLGFGDHAPELFCMIASKLRCESSDSEQPG